VLATLALAAPASAASLPGAPYCPVLPRSNAFNQRVDSKRRERAFHAFSIGTSG
jgi:hypothetical protein